MLRTFPAAGLAAAFALAIPAAFAQTPSAPMNDKTMSDKTMAPKKTMAKHHPMHKKSMTKTMAHPDAMKSGDMQQKM